MNCTHMTVAAIYWEVSTIKDETCLTTKYGCTLSVERTAQRSRLLCSRLADVGEAADETSLRIWLVDSVG